MIFKVPSPSPKDLRGMCALPGKQPTKNHDDGTMQQQQQSAHVESNQNALNRSTDQSVNSREASSSEAGHSGHAHGWVFTKVMKS